MVTAPSTRQKRTPASVTTHGKYTVTVWDEKAYRESIERYASQVPTLSPATNKPHNIQPFIKRKRMSTYNWTRPLKSKGA